MALYYDNMDWFSIRKYRSATLGGEALLVSALDNGKRTQWLADRVKLEGGRPVYLRLTIQERESQFSWSYDGENYQDIGPVYDTSKLSDEYCSQYGEFTGTMVGIFCEDRMFRRHCADFDFFEYVAEEWNADTSKRK